MGKHASDEDFPEFSGSLPVAGEKKEQLADKAPKGDGIGESSLSPIETW